jgi:hypothetical protein
MTRRGSLAVLAIALAIGATGSESSGTSNVKCKGLGNCFEKGGEVGLLQQKGKSQQEAAKEVNQHTEFEEKQQQAEKEVNQIKEGEAAKEAAHALGEEGQKGAEEGAEHK